MNFNLLIVLEGMVEVCQNTSSDAGAYRSTTVGENDQKKGKKIEPLASTSVSEQDFHS